MPPAQSNRDDLILQRLDQIHNEIIQVRDDLKADLHDYELKALHDKDVETLNKRDEDQEQHLQRLEDRVLSQGQRMFLNICSAIGVIGGFFTILHWLHIV